MWRPNFPTNLSRIMLFHVAIGSVARAMPWSRIMISPFPPFLAALRDDGKWRQKEGRLGLREIDADLVVIFWKRGPPIAIPMYPFQTLIADKNFSILPIFSRRGEIENGARHRECLSLIRGEERFFRGVGRLTLIWPEFPGNSEHPSPFEGYHPQTLIADKNCPIWPIFQPPWKQHAYGVSNRACVAFIRVRKEGRFGQWGAGRGCARISRRAGRPSPFQGIIWQTLIAVRISQRGTFFSHPGCSATMGSKIGHP